MIDLQDALFELHNFFHLSIRPESRLGKAWSVVHGSLIDTPLPAQDLASGLKNEEENLASGLRGKEPNTPKGINEAQDDTLKEMERWPLVRELVRFANKNGSDRDDWCKSKHWTERELNTLARELTELLRMAETLEPLDDSDSAFVAISKARLNELLEKEYLREQPQPERPAQSLLVEVAAECEKRNAGVCVAAEVLCGILDRREKQSKSTNGH